MVYSFSSHTSHGSSTELIGGALLLLVSFKGRSAERGGVEGEKGRSKCFDPSNIESCTRPNSHSVTPSIKLITRPHALRMKVAKMHLYVYTFIYIYIYIYI